MTTYEIGLAITILIQIIGFVWKFSKMDSQMKDNTEKISSTIKKLNSVNSANTKISNLSQINSKKLDGVGQCSVNENRIHQLELSDKEIKYNIKTIDEKLNRILGKLDMFFELEVSLRKQTKTKE